MAHVHVSVMVFLIIVMGYKRYGCLGKIPYVKRIFEKVYCL